MSIRSPQFLLSTEGQQLRHLVQRCTRLKVFLCFSGTDTARPVGQYRHKLDKTRCGWSSSCSGCNINVFSHCSCYSCIHSTTAMLSVTKQEYSLSSLAKETRLDFQQSSTRRPHSPSSCLEAFIKSLYDSILLLGSSLKREDAKQNKAPAWNKMNSFPGTDLFSLEISFPTFSHSPKGSSTYPLHHSAKIIRRKSGNHLSDTGCHVAPPLPPNEYWAFKQMHNVNGVSKNLTEV